MKSSCSMSKILKKVQALNAHLFMMTKVPHENGVPIDANIQEVLDKYDEVFVEPKSLPPARALDHSIPLKPGAMPVNLRPSRYNYHQKNELEKQVKDMFTSGLIQHSKSNFSSPTLLVKKKDGTWRFCVDYRDLNDITIKDKYPIPIVDDLLDELCSATMFSKVEYRVMPFGLTNAPATFQALIKQIFKPFLRKFVLVFFDDILIHSLTTTDHIQHLRVVFATLKTHSLFEKKSKCSFGQPQVEYLVHINNKDGVAYPQKIQVMVD